MSTVPYYVFVFDLMSPQPVVHDGPRSWSPAVSEIWEDGTTRRDVIRTKCGRRELEIQYYRRDGSSNNTYDNMTLILGRHAQAIGAHWCRTCFGDDL